MCKKLNEIFDLTQFLSGENAIFISQLYLKFLQDKNTIPKDWRDFFKSLSDLDRIAFEVDFFGPNWKKKNISVILEDEQKVKKIEHQITFQKKDLRDIFLKYGHISAKLDPIFEKSEYYHENLLEVQDGDEFHKFNSIYCHTVGVEFDHILNIKERNWLIENFESKITSSLQKEEKIKILNQIIEAETFEQFLHTKFPGMKRFSIEGSESSIVLVHEFISESLRNNIKDIKIGMAHRGRLNFLTHITGKPYYKIFSEFLKTAKPDEEYSDISWDVKYHAGYTTKKSYNGDKIGIQMAFNPSHLEAVNPVAMGMSYAENQIKKSIPILIHGDAAMMGQGIVAECFNISGIDGYNSGGVIHLVINNQIGFTAESCDSRFSRYCTDVAKMSECPIFHINADDPESCFKIARLAIRYREEFKKDIVLDVIGFRKYGHNEGDEPLYTNPIMYEKIQNRKSIPEKYAEFLVSNSIIESEYLKKKKLEIIENLDLDFKKAQEKGYKIKKNLSEKFNDINFDIDPNLEIKTGIERSIISEILLSIYQKPSDFNLNSRLEKQIEVKIKNFTEKNQLDWSVAEMLAFGSILKDGNSLRLTGQDVERGTFSHRHAILTDYKNGNKYNILSSFANEKAKIELKNSPLSEFGCLGFEYGYSLINPDHLTIWEAQFGDFSNGASTIIDQFISSAEKKWLLMSGIVLLLPHGFEGQGPEHSSARLERFLQLCAQSNIIVANCTTPANFFHILRRQLKAKYRKPLIIMSPKSLLRHKSVVSNLSEFDDKTYFQPIIGEINKNIDHKKIKRIIITSGKLFYDLMEAQNEKKAENISIIRIEQYYPFANEIFEAEISKYPNAKEFIWAQEEPKNMGAWHFIRDYISESIKKIGYKNELICISRPESASPATGFEKNHLIEQGKIVDECISF